MTARRAAQCLCCTSMRSSRRKRSSSQDCQPQLLRDDLMAHRLRMEDSDRSCTKNDFRRVAFRCFADELIEFALAKGIIRLAAQETMDSRDAVQKVSYRCFIGPVSKKPCVWIFRIWLMSIAESMAIEFCVVVDEEHSVWCTDARSHDGGFQREVELPSNQVQSLASLNCQVLFRQELWPRGSEADVITLCSLLVEELRIAGHVDFEILTYPSGTLEKSRDDNAASISDKFGAVDAFHRVCDDLVAIPESNRNRVYAGWDQFFEANVIATHTQSHQLRFVSPVRSRSGGWRITELLFQNCWEFVAWAGHKVESRWARLEFAIKYDRVSFIIAKAALIKVDQTPGTDSSGIRIAHACPLNYSSGSVASCVISTVPSLPSHDSTYTWGRWMILASEWYRKLADSITTARNSYSIRVHIEHSKRAV